MKRRRRVEIVQYSRRVTLTGGNADANARATAEYLAGIETLLMTPGTQPHQKVRMTLRRSSPSLARLSVARGFGSPG